MNNIAFYLIIFLTNIIQGITGFAGTILAMPPGLMLVGYDVAKPVLNVLGILAGIYVFISQGKHVNWKELRKVVLVMAVGIFSGIFLKALFANYESLLYKCLGAFVLVLAVQGYWKLVRPEKKEKTTRHGAAEVKSYALLVGSGVAHGMFVSGGPLLISYLSEKIRDKVGFRATISTVWIILNTIILIDDIREGLWTQDLIVTQMISIPFFAAGMIAGTVLYKRMSQLLFMKLTYILLFISGITLLVK